MAESMTFDVLSGAVAGNSAAAFRCITEYQPMGGKGDKVFPPTYEGGKYATEERILPGYDEPVPCVLLNSVQSEANHMELALLDAWEGKRIKLPVITVDFSGNDLEKELRITSLEAPHRIADALLRDSQFDDVMFRKTEQGKRLDFVDNKNATALLELCPTALLFGMWDSTGPKGGLGAKFARAIVSEVVGVNAKKGVNVSSRIDPAEIVKNAGPVFRATDGGYTVDPNDENILKSPDGKKLVLFKQSKNKDVYWDIEKNKDQIPDQGRPSVINHGNVVPSLVYQKDQNNNVIKDKNGNPIDVGGFTIEKATQTTVLSLPALRRLKFPVNGTPAGADANNAARTLLAALGLLAATLTREKGMDLRSRCQLFPTAGLVWELLDNPGKEPKQYSLTSEQAISLFNQALKMAKEVDLPWMDEEMVLKPSPQLAALVRKSQELAASTTGAAGEG